eukprot:jgi/Picsp_1/4324/NSC_01832-R1_protein
MDTAGIKVVEVVSAESGQKEMKLLYDAEDDEVLVVNDTSKDNAPVLSLEETDQVRYAGAQGTQPSTEELPCADSKENCQQSCCGRRLSLEAGPYDFNDPMFSSDEFRVWEMKIRKCPKSRPHDWTMCPFAHPGEKARRRDPRIHNYCGTACADYRKFGSCSRGDSCLYAHGVFECWLHPARYRTQLCTDGIECQRKVCFFAHRETELRQPTAMPTAQVVPPTSGDFSSDARGRDHIASPLASAIQMLDPASKRRLLEALQRDMDMQAVQREMDTQVNAAASSFFGSSATEEKMPQPQRFLDSQSLIDPFKGLRVDNSSQNMQPRRSVDFHAFHGAGSGPYYQQNIPFNRKSVDIGSLSRDNHPMAHSFSNNLMMQSNFFESNGLSSMGRNSYDGNVHQSQPSAVQIGLPTASQDYEDHYTNEIFHRHLLGDLGATELGRKKTSMDENRIQLGRIAENHAQEDESESAESSSGGLAARSGSGSSSFDGISQTQDKRPFQRAFSIENILAELPRSASQVDLSNPR